jgi:DNA polymerase sigma
MTLSKGEKIRVAIRDNPLKTDRDKKRFKKQVLDLVNDYVMFVLDEFGERHMKLEKLEKQVLKMFKN